MRSRTHPSTGPVRPFGRRSPGWRHLRRGYLPALVASFLLGVFVSAPNVFAATSVISVTTTSLPSGEIGAAYSFKLSGSGGTGTFAWSVSTGALPTGLMLSSRGVISGTPSVAGSQAVTLELSDADDDTTTAAFTLSIAALFLPRQSARATACN